jgi:type I restriction enzyme S subunit
VLGIEACFPDSVVGFIVDSDKVVPEYVEYFVRTAKADLVRFAPATAQKNINLDTLATVSIPVAPLDEQREVVRSLNSIFAHADRLEAEAARARALLDRLETSILTKAFRGELVPQDPNEGPPACWWSASGRSVLPVPEKPESLAG